MRASISAVLMSLVLTFCVSATPAAGQGTWAQRLGFPPDQRVVILHANELGIAYECNRPAQAGLSDGLLTSASVVTTGPWFAECAAWAKENPDHDLGVSLSFLSPSAVIKWGPVAPCQEVPSLTTVDGYLSPSLARFHVQADAEQVRREAEAQIQRARNMGIQPTHLHPHLGAVLVRPDLVRVYLELGREYWIPAVMVEITPELIERFRARGFPLDEEMLEAMAEYPLPKVDDVRNVVVGDTYEETREQFCTMIEQLEPGITQIFLNPADDSPGMRRACKVWQQRAWEARLLADGEVRDFLKEQGVDFTNWREIMQRFESAGEPNGG